MISILTTLLLVMLLFLTGKIFESVKRFIVLIFDVCLKILNFFGIKINLMEPRCKVSKKFRDVFKDIRTVKKSKQNQHIVRSIHTVSLVILLFCVVMIALNIINEKMISTWLYQIPIFKSIMKGVDQMDTTFTATMFSVMSFSLSKLISHWKQTSSYRKAKRDIKVRNKVLSDMSSKDLLDMAKMKDLDRLSTVKQQSEHEQTHTE